MRYLTFVAPEPSRYEICFLTNNLNKAEIRRLYIEPHLQDQEASCLAYSLCKTSGNPKVAELRAYLSELLPILKSLGVTYLVVNDAHYYNTMTKGKATSSYGFVRPCVMGDFQVVYVPPGSQVFHNPVPAKESIQISLQALKSHQKGTYIEPGQHIIKKAIYPKTVQEISDCLDGLLSYPHLAADIEAFSLKHWSAGIGTISFAIDRHHGIAFPVDLHHEPAAVRALLLKFFRNYQGRVRWHKIDYDVTVLIYQLFMEDLTDTYGLLDGLEVMLKNWDCTRLITYLATNNTSRNVLGLKPQTQEFTGNYAIEEIQDIRSIPIEKLLEYNLIDSLATNYLYDKHWPTLVVDDQEQIYRELFQPSMVDVIQMQLTGMPLNMKEVKRFEREILTAQNKELTTLRHNPLIHSFTAVLNQQWADKKNSVLKVKRVTAADGKVIFNPNSGPQLIGLLYEHIKLPVLANSDSGLPSTEGETLQALLNHTTDPDVLALLNALIDFKAAVKIITSFLPHLLSAPQSKDGWHYLFGNFNLGGTLSGRMSSSDPNLQNLPANPKKRNKWAKAFKKCFQAPPGWLFCGLDFASLEDKISALTTRDPNKLKVYLEKFDGHCLRSYSYFNDQMAGIIPDDRDSINSIADKYPELRQESKNPTFALTYQGTFRTLMTNCGFSEEKARRIEKAYQDLYQVSIQWVAQRIKEAGEKGYAVLAFGLRLRTPLLHQVVLGTSRTPYEAEAEGRTVGNALGQSWCMLNNRAGVEFNRKIRASKHRHDIRPCSHIHDAQYFIIRNDPEVVLWVNEHLVAAANWNHDPLIYHPDIPLGGELSIFFPSWAEEMVVPNGADRAELERVCLNHAKKYNLI